MPAIRPNILLITAHDLGTELGCYGRDPALRTPHLDRLASQGVRFDRYFASAPFCSPSRGAMLTGMAPHVNGLMGLVNLGWDLPPGPRTLGQHLRDAGYETGLFGLQHEAKDTDRLGFDFVTADAAPWAAGMVAPSAAAWLRRRRAADRPFYMQVGFLDVHRDFPPQYALDAPLESIRPLPWLADTPGHRDDLRDFYGYIEQMDRHVGLILAALDDSPLRDDTLIVFTTDHGVAFPRAKSTLYDPGLHTALVMRWPNGFAGGRLCAHLLSNMDLTPTALEAAGLPVPEGLQGRSFLPALRGDAYTPRAWIFAETNTVPWNIGRCIRTDRYKYIAHTHPGPVDWLPIDSAQSKTRRDMGGPPFWRQDAVELYDLRHDPLEQRNLAGSPDAAIRKVEQDLAGLLRRFQEETHDPLLAGPIGRPPEEEVILRRLYPDVYGSL
jgi:arylsulfatase A-like enzyme